MNFILNLCFNCFTSTLILVLFSNFSVNYYLLWKGTNWEKRSEEEVEVGGATTAGRQRSRGVREDTGDQRKLQELEKRELLKCRFAYRQHYLCGNVCIILFWCMQNGLQGYISVFLFLFFYRPNCNRWQVVRRIHCCNRSRPDYQPDIWCSYCWSDITDEA